MRRASRPAPRCHVLPHRQPAEELVHLVTLGQSELTDRGDIEAGDVTAFEHDPAGVGCTSQVSILKNVRLARAVRTDDTPQLAATDPEIDVAVCQDAAETPAHTLRFENGPAVPCETGAWRIGVGVQSSDPSNKVSASGAGAPAGREPRE